MYPSLPAGVESRVIAPLAANVRHGRLPDRFRRLMRKGFLVQNTLLGASALLVAAAHFMPERDHTGPVLNAAVTFVNGADSTTSTAGSAVSTADGEVAGVTEAAVSAFAGVVRGLSRPEALETAFKSYFAYKTAHPNDVRKPYLYL